MCGEVMVCNIRVVYWDTVYVVLSYCPATWTADYILPADRTAVNFVNTFPSRVERYHRLLICCWYCLCCHGNDTDMQDKTSPLLCMRIGLYIAPAKQLVPSRLLLISHYHFYTSHAYVFNSGIFIVSHPRTCLRDLDCLQPTRQAAQPLSHQLSSQTSTDQVAGQNPRLRSLETRLHPEHLHPVTKSLT